MASPARKHVPHARLKVLRKVTKLTQVKLAARIGKSYPYVLSIECGQRPLPPSMADLIARVTGISPDWLLGQGAVDRPVDVLNNPYTEELWSLYDQPAPLVGRLPLSARHIIWRTCFDVTRTLRAVARKGRLGVGQRFVTLALGRCIEDEKDEGLGAKGHYLRETNFLIDEPQPDYPHDFGRSLARGFLSPDLLYQLDDVSKDGTTEEKRELLMHLKWCFKYLEDALKVPPDSAESSKVQSTDPSVSRSKNSPRKKSSNSGGNSTQLSHPG